MSLVEAMKHSDYIKPAIEEEVEEKVCFIQHIFNIFKKMKKLQSSLKNGQILQ